MKKKHSWIKIVAVLAAVAGAAVAIFAFLKKKGKKIKEELDFDEEMYFDDDEFEDDIMNGDETVAPEEDADEDTAPEESADTAADAGEQVDSDADAVQEDKKK